MKASHIWSAGIRYDVLHRVLFDKLTNTFPDQSLQFNFCFFLPEEQALSQFSSNLYRVKEAGSRSMKIGRLRRQTVSKRRLDSDTSTDLVSPLEKVGKGNVTLRAQESITNREKAYRQRGPLWLWSDYQKWAVSLKCLKSEMTSSVFI